MENKPHNRRSKGGFKSRRKFEEEKVEWIPRTELGKQVKAEEIESIDAIRARGKVIREAEIADFFIPDLEERIIKIGNAKRPFKWVQRMTDSGRRNKYFVIVTVGNKNGYVGIAEGRAKEYGTAIAQAVRKAKLNLIKVPRSCGSWDCGCSDQHSIPAVVEGKSGSVKVKLMPAPKGTGLAAYYVSKDLLELAGITDVWSKTYGHTKTRANLAFATFDALKKISQVKK